MPFEPGVFLPLTPRMPLPADAIDDTNPGAALVRSPSRTLNAELTNRVEELARANRELQNLMDASDIATLFLDRELRIKRHTPPARSLFHLIASETGRPLADLSHRLEPNTLAINAAQVLLDHIPIEREVRGLAGRWFLARFIPYRTLENRDDGVVLTFIDVTARKHAEEELRHAHENLARSVQRRTAELDHANQALREEILERKRAQQDRQDLLRRLACAQEAERGHVSRELHDQMGQHLTALILGLKSLRLAIPDTDHVDSLRTLLETAETVGRETHELALQLRPTALDDLGLLLALGNYAEKWSERAKVKVCLHSQGLDHARLPRHIETMLYRIACEALNNVLKHARATQVSILLERRPASAHIIIEDDGSGFDPDALQAHGYNGRLGLRGMKERASLLDGELVIESAPGRGTTIFGRVPLNPASG